MDPSKLVTGHVGGKIDCNDFNEAFQSDAVKNETNEIDIFANSRSNCNSSSRSETEFEDHKHFTDGYQEQNEKLELKNLDTKYFGHSKSLENLSTRTCSTVGIKNEDIDIFYEDIKRETGDEKSREFIGFCKSCYQSFGDETNFFNSTSYRFKCSCQKQNVHGEDKLLDVKPSFFDLSTDLGLKPLEVQDDMKTEDEVTKEGDSSALARRFLLHPTENDKKMKRKLSPESLENTICVAKKKVQFREKPFCCKICSKSFRQKYEMTVHLRVHTGEKPFHCKICSKSFRQKGDLTVHERVHTGEKPYCCKICFKAFGSSSDLRAHEKIHKGEKPFCCKICSKSFTTSRNLRGHGRSHTGEKLFHCKICSKSFSQKGHLKIHEMSHTDEKPFHCKICSKSFIQKVHLKLHERSHTGENPFHCKFCSKSYSQKGHLKIHERSHTGEKPFHCKICSKAFSDSSNLRVHEKNHTVEKPFRCKI